MCSVCVNGPSVASDATVRVNVMILLSPAGIATAPSLVIVSPVGIGVSKMLVMSSAAVSVPPLLVKVNGMSLDVPCVIVPHSRLAGTETIAAGVITIPFPGIDVSCPSA